MVQELRLQIRYLMEQGEKEYAVNEGLKASKDLYKVKVREANGTIKRLWDRFQDVEIGFVDKLLVKESEKEKLHFSKI